jgi:hypothetical protein
LREVEVEVEASGAPSVVLSAASVATSATASVPASLAPLAAFFAALRASRSACCSAVRPDLRVLVSSVMAVVLDMSLNKRAAITHLDVIFFSEILGQQ